MPNKHIIIKTDALDTILYHQDNTIYMLNEKEMPITENTVQDFSISQTPKGNLLLFYRQINGDAYLAKLSVEGKSESRKLMTDIAFTKAFKCVYAQSEALGSCFFYTIPSGKKDCYHLYATNFSSDGPEKIDTLQTMHQKDFYFYDAKYPAIIYRNQQNMLMLCIFNGQKIGTFKQFVLSRRADCIYDISFAENDDKIHLCYIMKQLGNAYLMYKSLFEGILSTNQSLNLKKDLVSCNVFVANDTLFAFSVARNCTYYAFSKDNGESFYPSTIFFHHIIKPDKAAAIIRSSNSLHCLETYLENNNPTLLNSFYMQNKTPRLENKENSEIIQLKQKVISFEKELKDKNLQISQLSKTPTPKAPQMNSNYMAQLSKQYESLMFEKGRLISANESLKNQVQQLRHQLHLLSNSPQAQQPNQNQHTSSKAQENE